MALRHVLLRLRTCAAARGREAMAARSQSRACVRARAVRAEAKAVSSAAVACAEARARAVRACIYMGQRRVEAAAAMAGKQLRRASDRTLSTMLRAAYGESAPPTPSPRELLLILECVMEDVKKVKNILSIISHLLELFSELDPHVRAAIVAGLVAPFALLRYAVPDFLLYPEPCAAEPLCPFLAVALPHDLFPADDALEALASVSATCGYGIILFVGGIVISLCIDIGHPLIGDHFVALNKPFESTMWANLMTSSAAKKLTKMKFTLVAGSPSEEDARAILELFNIIETNSELTKLELNVLDTYGLDWKNYNSEFTTYRMGKGYITLCDKMSGKLKEEGNYLRSPSTDDDDQISVEDS